MRKSMLMAVALCLCGAGLRAAGLSAEDQEGIKSTTRQFLGALVRDDRITMRGMVPQKPENKWGPYPFTSSPTMKKVVVHKSKAGVFFEGGHEQAGLPPKCLLALASFREGKELVWKVRGVFWYERVPRSARLPEESTTKEDRDSEKDVVACVKAYKEAWERSDYAVLDRLTFHWVQDAGRKHPIRLKGLDFGKITGSGNEARVSFTARLRVLTVIPYKVRGTLEAVKEDGQWKVREKSIAF